VLFFDYPNDGPIAWSGDRLGAELNELSVHHPKLRLAIVAHSMGGLVARQALEATDSPPSAVIHLFMLGTPNHGSRLAGAQSWVEILRAVPSGRLLSADLLRDGLSEAADDLKPESRFLEKLNSRRRPAAVRYFSAIGRRSFISNDRRERLRRELEDLFRRRKTAAELQAAVLDALAAEELQDGRGDGAVAVTSARFSGADNERLFDLNHVELLALPGAQPKQAEVFDWIVRSLHWSRQDD
jgi:pimeloyl-ACP methyl ester carboxylesterase